MPRAPAPLCSSDLTLRRLVGALRSDPLADRVAKNCHDPHHDDRSCGTCSARWDGIDEYREDLLKILDNR